jgi:hypothetical protein
MLFDHNECGFSRFAQPNAHSWAMEGETLRLVRRDPPGKEKQKAIACFGAVRHDTGQVRQLFEGEIVAVLGGTHLVSADDDMLAQAVDALR